jgi:hypothetical protein
MTSHSLPLNNSCPLPSWKAGRRCKYVALGTLALHAALLAYIAAGHSPNWDEMAHLPSGLSHWTFRRFDLYCVNPPLTRMIAALPVVLADAKTDWAGYPAGLYTRPEFDVGRRFIEINGRDAFSYYVLARWTLIPVCLIGPWIAYCWAAQLYGRSAGLLALTLYCCCPNLLAWGASITPDAAAASLGLLAAYWFWRWLRFPAWPNALAAGVALGVAELTKSSWLILFGLWPVLWIAYTRFCRNDSPLQASGTRRATARQMTVIVLVAVYLLNMGYGFEGAFKPLRAYSFVSRALSGEDSPPAGGNRFRASVWGYLPVPFPENYVRGIDIQRYDFEQKQWSYLRGEQRLGGWWYYYLYALVVKTPLCVLILLVCAVVAGLFGRGLSSMWCDEMVVLAPAIALFALVSSQTGFNRYFRYVVPALPFLYVFIGRLALLGRSGHLARVCEAPDSLGRTRHEAGRIGTSWATALAILTCGSVIESLATVPHSHSFFSCLIGGPLKGHAHLVDANIDWGEDIPFLKSWYDSHPHARPIYWAYFGGYRPEESVSGISWRPVPESATINEERDTSTSLPPGWYVVSANYLRGYKHLGTETPSFTHFLAREPVARIGYSTYIYHMQ